jgi:hypothetical protein
MRHRVEAGYRALNGLLHPDTPKGSEEQVRGMVESYSDKEDWIHAVLGLATGVWGHLRD